MKAPHFKSSSVRDLRRWPSGLPVRLNSWQSGERLSASSGSDGWIFHTVLPGNPTLLEAAQREGGERKFSLVPRRRGKMNERWGWWGGNIHAFCLAPSIRPDWFLICSWNLSEVEKLHTMICNIFTPKSLVLHSSPSDSSSSLWILHPFSSAESSCHLQPPPAKHLLVVLKEVKKALGSCRDPEKKRKGQMNCDLKNKKVFCTTKHSRGEIANRWFLTRKSHYFLIQQNVIVFTTITSNSTKAKTLKQKAPIL